MPPIPLMPAMPLIALPFSAEERARVEPFGEDGMFIFMSPFPPSIDDISFIPDDISFIPDDISFIPDDISFIPDGIPFIPDDIPFMSARVVREEAGPMPGIPAMLFARDASPFAFNMPGMDPIPGMSAIAPCPDAAAVPPLVLVFRPLAGERDESIPAIPGMLAIDFVLSTFRV